MPFPLSRPQMLLGVAVLLLAIPSAAILAHDVLRPAAPPDTPPAAHVEPFTYTGPMRWGVEAEGIDDVRALNLTPAFGMVWAGKWSGDEGWRYVAGVVNRTHARGVTPLVQWYYWADDLTRHAIEHGQDGKSRDEWFRYARELADLLAREGGGREAYVVLETEFNHPEMVDYPYFDDLLAQQARLFRERAPGVKVVLGFGNWDPPGWSTFPRAAEASDLLGFQLMRGPGVEGVAETKAAFLAAEEAAREMRARFPEKPLFLHDLAITTYGHPDGEAIQAEALARLLTQEEIDRLKGFGVTGIAYRHVRDFPGAPPGYYGEGERHFGLKRADGTPKPAWSVWVQAMREKS